MKSTRLAPSPTGALHLGNARTFLLTWLAARARGLGLPLRIEDIDSPRKKPGATELLLEDLRWLGIDWDGAPLIQSTRHAEHVRALDQLIANNLVYACACSRKDVESAQSAPHAEDDLVYPGTCRGKYNSAEQASAVVSRPVALRFRVPKGVLAFEDEFLGLVRLDPSVHGGDFVVARFDPATGYAPGYQLAVVVDDAAQEIDFVIRGDDLLTSTPRQRLLQTALGFTHPATAHLPLVVGADGRRLAKRHGDTRIASYREEGVPASRIRAWVAKTSGFPEKSFQDPTACRFSWDAVPRGAVVVPAHDLRAGPP